MSADPGHEVTRLLQAATDGDQEAFDRVFALVYDELHRLASHVRRGRAGETLGTTALVHEAYLRLLPSQDLDWEGRSHFMGVAARAMRQVLVRAAEKRTAAKRGGGQAAATLDEQLTPGEEFEPERLILLDEVLTRLESFAPRQARVVECRFFAGYSVEETASILDVSGPTVKRDWQTARAWLSKEMST